MAFSDYATWIKTAAALFAVSGLTLCACSSSDSQGTTLPETGGAGGTAQDSGGSGGGTSDPFANAAFPGIDTSVVSAGIAPDGCLGGFDPATEKLTLKLSSAGSALLLAISGSEIQANGVTCTSPSGEKATTANTAFIQVDGGDGAQTVIVDLSTGDFGTKILGVAGGINLDLAGGDDTAMLRTTEQDDTVRAGTSAGKATLGVGTGTTGNVWFTGVERLVVSLGPGKDSFSAGSASGFEGPSALSISVFAGAGDDSVQGGNGDDALNGNEGDDSFDEGDADNGGDTINGGPDQGNTVSYERRTLGLSVTMCASSQPEGCASPTCNCDADDGASDEHDNLINVFHFIGGTKGDTVTGTPGNDTIDGRDGDDYLYGIGGADTLYGGEGADTLDTGAGADYADCGGSDMDIAVVTSEDTVLNCELF